MSEARTRLREGNLEDVRAAAEAELEDARTAADARVLESQLDHKPATLAEERKHTMELEDRLAFLELEVESSSTWGSNPAVRLEVRVWAFERPHYLASGRSRCACGRSLRMTRR